MHFDARHSINTGLQHLAVRLNPIIADRLALDLGVRPWTSILTELDKVRGRVTKSYEETDLQSQLKVITERLGYLGHPFDDDTRIVLALGIELQIVRNRWEHNHELNAFDAFRTHDLVTRLLQHFGDTAGALGVTSLQEEARAAFTSEVKVTEQASYLQIEPSPLPQTTSPEQSAAAEDVVSPDPAVLIRANSFATPILGHDRYEYEPWVVMQVGTLKVLDDLRKKADREQVRAVATEIAEFEGPIHVDRLAKLASESFGLKKLRRSRVDQLKHQIKQVGLLIDTDKFVWPSDIDPSSWREFRPNDSTVTRQFSHISTVEIANVYRFIAARTPNMSSSELDSSVLQTFGRKRKTSEVARRLEQARALL